MGDKLSIPSRLTMHLGVNDIPYANAPERTVKAGKPSKKSARPPKAPASEATKTTGEVADMLEAKYGVMQAFFDAKKPQIEKLLSEDATNTLNTILNGKRIEIPFGEACEFIERMFRDFLITSEVESVGIKGVPTQAAQRGVDHRKKHPYKKGRPPRASFIDTGLYVNNFKVWID